MSEAYELAHKAHTQGLTYDEKSKFYGLLGNRHYRQRQICVSEIVELYGLYKSLLNTLPASLVLEGCGALEETLEVKTKITKMFEELLSR